MKSFIIAEIASNWEGNFTKARKLIKESSGGPPKAVCRRLTVHLHYRLRVDVYDLYTFDFAYIVD